MPRKVVRYDKTEQVKALGAKLRRRRQELGMSQAQVAGDRFTKAYISALETGQAAPSYSSMLHLSDKLKVPTAWLLSEDEIFVPPDLLDRAIGAAYAASDAELAEKLEEIKRVFDD